MSDSFSPCMSLHAGSPNKVAVAVVLGATGTGKSRLSIDLAIHFNAEIINSDKIQVYRGLNIATNKITDEESRGVPHHLLGILPPDEEFTADDFVRHALAAVREITGRGRLPIIVGGSNSYIKTLVLDKGFVSLYECCFLWLDVSMPVLDSFVSKRVDQMVSAGLVEEVGEFFEPGGDYTRGIRRAIGVPEMDEYLRNGYFLDEEMKKKHLDEAIDQIKFNTCFLARRQRENILLLLGHLRGRVHRFDATEALLKSGVEAEKAWEGEVVVPSKMIVAGFLSQSAKYPTEISRP